MVSGQIATAAFGSLTRIRAGPLDGKDVDGRASGMPAVEEERQVGGRSRVFRNLFRVFFFPLVGPLSGLTNGGNWALL